MKTSFVSRKGYLSLFVVFVSFLALIIMAESTGEAKSATKGAKSATKGGAKVYIILTEKPKGKEDPKACHLRTLSSALGSPQAAKDALVYSYTNAATGFSARLTPEQVTKISKLPGVNKVMESESYQLHKGMKLN